MSLRAHLWALDDAPVKNPTAVLVLVALADEADDRGRGACAFIDKIAERARCSKRSAQTHLRDLYRSRVINFGDSLIAEQRFKLSAGRCPRVWDLNLDATWSEVPEARTDEEMVAEYSDQIGLRPARRGADSAPLQIRGVQILHPSTDSASEQAKESDVDTEDHIEGCSPLHPRGAVGSTPGVQTAAPYPLVPAYTRTTSSSVLGLTSQDHERSEPEEEPDEDQKKPLSVSTIADWFVKLRSHNCPDDEPWIGRDVEAALATAVHRGMGTLDVAAQALRELVEGRAKYGRTDRPGRLLLDGDWWVAVKPKSAAARRQLAEEPRCQVPHHGRYPAARCVPCMAEALVQDDYVPTDDPKAQADAEAFVKALRQRQRGAGQEARGVAS